MLDFAEHALPSLTVCGLSSEPDGAARRNQSALKVARVQLDNEFRIEVADVQTSTFERERRYDLAAGVGRSFVRLAIDLGGDGGGVALDLFCLAQIFVDLIDAARLLQQRGDVIRNNRLQEKLLQDGSAFIDAIETPLISLRLHRKDQH